MADLVGFVCPNGCAPIYDDYDRAVRVHYLNGGILRRWYDSTGNLVKTCSPAQYAPASDSMARTVGLVKYIALHKEFQLISTFDMYIQGGLKKLYNDLAINMKISEGEDVCNSLLLTLQEEDYTITDQQDEILMGLAYSLVENWYYFIGILSLDVDNIESKRMARFLEVPSELIEEYLCCLYDISSPCDKRIKEIENCDIVKTELDNIEDDIIFIQKELDYNNVEQRVYKYMQYKFWK